MNQVQQINYELNFELYSSWFSSLSTLDKIVNAIPLLTTTKTLSSVIFNLF